MEINLRRVLNLKAQKHNNSLRFSIPDKSVRDDLKKKLNHNDIVVIEVIEVRKKGEFLKDVKDK